MGAQTTNEVFSQRLSDRDFARICGLVEGSVGIHLPAHKRSMVELRVAKRVRMLGMPGLDAYCDLVFNDRTGADERICLIDVITTNKTDFFREAEHFDRLLDDVVPDMRDRYPESGIARPFNIWSAGCSTGEEPYTIAMVLDAYTSTHPRFDFRIHATDISTKVLATAARAVYREERICGVPVELRRRALLRNKDHSLGLVRVAPEIRNRVRFSRHNLLSSEPLSCGRFDVIFCRNVIIYFEPHNQLKVLRHLTDSLLPGGYLFIGHSETLHGLPLPLEHAGPTLYRKVAD